MRNPIDEFVKFNRRFAGRHPDIMRFKVARMSESPFAFFRGSFHLFARDVIADVHSALPLFDDAGLETDIVGDLHAENYGTYKANDGLVHYDINDFDETTTGRYDFDVCRQATSVLLAAQDRGDALEPAIAATMAGVMGYALALRRLLGKSKNPHLDVGEASRCGCAPIDAIIDAGARAKKAAFIDKMTKEKNGKFQFKRSLKLYALNQSECDQATRLLADYRNQQKGLPEREGYFELLDVCGRVSGIGGMGRLRYLALLRGKPSDGAVVLEFKEALPSAYDEARNRVVVAKERGAQVAQMQRLSQSASNRFIGSASDGEQSFQVRRLGPSDGRVEAKTLPPGGMAGVAKVQGEILARVHARALTRQGCTELPAELGDPEMFCQRVLAFALGYADLARRDWVRFLGAITELEDVEKWMMESK